MRTTSAGVVLRISNAMDAGTYLALSWPGGGQGDPMPAGTSSRTVSAPPGPLTIRCGLQPSASAMIEVVDTDGYWSTTTLTDLGCSMAGLADWVVGSRTGATREEALDRLGSALTAAGTPGPITWTYVDIGYRDAATSTWVGSYDGRARLTALVSRQGSVWSAGPDAICG